MASEQQVKQYVAYWLQLGKKISVKNEKETLHIASVIDGDRYSLAFENCWERILSPDSGDCYVEGTTQSIQELLTPAWEITPCARCNILVPIISLGIQPLPCPCNDLNSWPNKELPMPRPPINSTIYLTRIQQHLESNRDRD